MARWWSVAVPADYKDVSERARQAPEVVAGLQSRRDVGAVIELTMYVNPLNHKLVITDTSYKELVKTRRELDVFEDAERQSSKIPGKETSYQPAHTQRLVVATQKITNADATTVSHKRWTGVATDGSTRSLDVGCIGPDEVCEPILSAVVVDESQFRTRESLVPVTATDIGEMIALGLFGVGILGVLVTVILKRRRSART
jgi:hypothetical protein